MTSPQTVMDAYLAALRATPEVVALVGGDASKITSAGGEAYESYTKAVQRMFAPSILVAWTGSQAIFNPPEWAKHRVTIAIRMDVYGKYADAWMALWNGNAAASGCRWLEYSIAPLLHPPDSPAMNRRVDAAGVEYFEFTTAFGDLDP